MYLVFKSKLEPGETVANINPGTLTENWIAGVRFEHPPQCPLTLTWRPESEEGTRRSYYSAGLVLMRKDLVSALTAAGVDNIDTYPVVIQSTRGRPACEDYVAANILGVVDAIDRSASELIDDDSGLMFFDSLAIDPKRAAGQLFFRLENARSTLIIHEDVAERINAPAFGLDCIDPTDHAS